MRIGSYPLKYYSDIVADIFFFFKSESRIVCIDAIESVILQFHLDAVASDNSHYQFLVPVRFTL